MQFPCPSCLATISANFAKPGKFMPKCPKCGQPIQVLIQVSKPSGTGPVKAPPPRAPAESSAADLDSTIGPVPRPLSEKKARPQPTSDPDATFATSPPADDDPDLDLDSTSGFQPSARDNVEMTAAFQSALRDAMDPQSTMPSAGEIAGAKDDVESTSAFVSKASGESDSLDASVDGNATTEFGGAKKPKPKPVPVSNKPVAKTENESLPEIPDQIGGYEILKTLGQGGMGAVFLARQISLDRPVALKVMNERFARDTVFVARFVREAYAAAQLTHHNVVQIYDIGAEEGINYFSMEFVRGGSLGDALKKNGKIPAPEAVGYIVQAARGLKFAHDRGMVHRDIKPDNLMLNTDGIVKVADMGLIKTGRMTATDDATSDADKKTGSALRELADVTNVGSAMGSPSYMAPEQCRDASSVDHRADVYSLGCTLYALLSGRTPFQGKTAVEVITKHLEEPPPPLETVVKDIPKPLAEIVNRTLVKDPRQRIQSMDELIDSLKSWQESRGLATTKPTEDQLALFEGLVKKMSENNFAHLAQRLGTAGPVLGVAMALVALAFNPVISAAILFAVASAMAVGFVASGIMTHSYLFGKVRSWVFSARVLDWFTFVGSSILIVLILFLTGLFWVALIAFFIGGLIGFGFAFLLVKPSASARLDSKEDLEGVLKRLRLQGMEEDAVRGFVIDAAGDRWEEVYETLFGYEEKVSARTQYASKIANRPQYASWRDGLIARLNATLEARRQKQAQKVLQKIETARLKAQGLSEAEAKAQARDAAEDLVLQGEEIRAANQDKAKKVNVRQIMSRYNQAKLDRPLRKRPNPVLKLLKGLVGIPFDPRLRLLAGAVVLIAGLLWIRQEAATVVPKPGTTMNLIERLEPIVQRGEGPPLKVSGLPIPSEILAFFNSPNLIVAGILLVLATFVPRSIAMFVVLFGAAVALAGHKVGFPLPTDLGPFMPSHLAASAGTILGLFGLTVLGSDGGQGQRSVESDEEGE